MKFNKKLRTIFIDSHSDGLPFDSKEKVNIILSPSLYWVKKMTLPVKYVRDALKLLPSIFEDILPEGKYSYKAYKKDGEFYIFAYEDKMILDLLTSQGIHQANIENVHFAQSELSDIKGAKTINENESIYLKDSILVITPTAWIQESSPLNLEEIKLSKERVVLEKFGHIVDKKSLYKIGAIIIIFSVLIFSEYIITSQKIEKIALAQEKLFDKYKLKSTIFQNEALLKNYKSTHSRQMKIREYTASILALALNADEKLSILSLKNNTLVAELTGISMAREIHLLKILKSKGMKIKAKHKEKSWRLEIVL